MNRSLAIYSPVFSSLDGSHGGITSVVLGLLDGLGDSGIDVHLLVRSDALSPEQSALTGSNVFIHPLGRHGRRRERREVLRWLRRHEPDALLTAGHRFNLIGVQAGRRSGIPTVVSVHNNLSRQLDRKAPWRRIARLREIRSTYRHALAVVAVSSGVANDLQQWIAPGDTRIKVIPNPVLPRAAGQPMQTPDHPWLGSSREVPVLLAAGRLSIQKDYPTLIRAFASLRQQRDCRLIILGEGDQREEIMALARELGALEDVSMPGFQRGVRAWMAAADLLVLSSAWEGFGNVLVEALSVGTPVVSTDCESGPAEILRGGEVGPLVAVGDHEALAAAIARTLDRPPERRTLLDAAEPYRSTTIARRYLDVLGLEPVDGPASRTHA